MIRLGFILTAYIFLLISFTPISLAHDGVVHDTPEEAQEHELESTSSAKVEMEKVEYELPYPGMLPDNPLYFLKTARDAIVKFLISDSLKEAEFNILTANKRAYAALLLSEKGNHELTLETISKSNNYLHEAVVSLGKAREKKMEIGVALDNAQKSVKKHRDVFSQQIMPNTPEKMKKDLEREIKRLEDIEKAVSSLASK